MSVELHVIRFQYHLFVIIKLLKSSWNHPIYWQSARIMFFNLRLVDLLWPRHFFRRHAGQISGKLTASCHDMITCLSRMCWRSQQTAGVFAGVTSRWQQDSSISCCSLSFRGTMIKFAWCKYNSCSVQTVMNSLINVLCRWSELDIKGWVRAADHLSNCDWKWFHPWDVIYNVRGHHQERRQDEFLTSSATPAS